MNYELIREDSQVFDLEVEYSWHGKHYKSSMEGPEEWPEIEIESITCFGKKFDVTKSEMEKIEQSISDSEN